MSFHRRRLTRAETLQRWGLWFRFGDWTVSPIVFERYSPDTGNLERIKLWNVALTAETSRFGLWLPGTEMSCELYGKREWAITAAKKKAANPNILHPT